MLVGEGAPLCFLHVIELNRIAGPNLKVFGEKSICV